MNDASSRLSASAAWRMAPATAGVQAMKTGKPDQYSSGRIRTDQRNGAVRRQRFRTQTGRKAPGFRRLMHRIFCHVPFRRIDSAGKGKTNHRLNDKPGNLWYSLTERQGRAPSLMTKRPENRLRMDGGIPSGSRRAQQRLSEQKKEFQVRSQADRTEPAPGRETPVYPTTLNRSGRRCGHRWGFS